MATQISHDPFARSSLMREPVLRQHNLECKWCGQRARFFYYWDADDRLGPRYGRNLDPFCTVGCYRSFNS